MTLGYWLIHSPWQSIKQIDEFGGGSNDGCGPYALMMLMCGYEGRTPSYAEGEAIRSEMIAHNLFSGGCRLDNLRDEARRRSYRAVYFHDWQDTPLPESVITHALSFGRGVIFEVHNAAALPNNEQGVKNHFIVVAAVNSDVEPWHGYILNSDISRLYRPPHGGPTAGYWSHDIVATLRGASAQGYLVLEPAPAPTPTPEQDIPGVIKDLNDVRDFVEKAVADALAKAGKPS